MPGSGHILFQCDPCLADHTYKTLINKTYEAGYESGDVLTSVRGFFS